MKNAVATFLFLFIIISTNAYSQSQVDQDSSTYWLTEYEKYKEKDHLKAAKVLRRVFTQTYIEGDSVKSSYYAFNIAGHYSSTDSIRSSMQYYGFAISLNPDEPLFYEFRGLLKHELNDYRGAISDYKDAIKLSKRQHIEEGREVRWELFKRYGGTYQQMGRFDEAIENYNISLNLLSHKYQNSQAVFDYLSDVIILNRGLCFFGLEKMEDACMDWSKAGELGIMKSYELIKEYCN